MKPLSILSLLLLLVTLTSVSRVLAESEPNDTFGTADPIAIGYASGEINATLTSDDNDYFVFTAVAGRTYVIETYNIQGTFESHATGLWLYNNSGTEIANDRYGSNGTGNADARITYTFSTSGNYYVRVKDSIWDTNWTGTYALRILPKYNEPGAGWDASNDDEPNDALPIANLLETSWIRAQTHQLFPHQNFVTNDTDYDWYYFTTPSNRTYVIETFNIQGAFQSHATGLWLYNDTGSEIANDRYGSNGTGTADARIVQTFTTGGTYFIKVKNPIWDTVWTGTYSIRLLPKYGEPGDSWDLDNDFEPNDALEIASTLHVGPEYAQTHQLASHAGYVTNDSDHDYYHFTIATPGIYNIETFGITANGRATGLWLYNESGSELSNDRSGNAANGQAHITYNFLASGTYIILVKDAYATEWSGTYSVRVCLETCTQNIYLPTVIR